MHSSDSDNFSALLPHPKSSRPGRAKLRWNIEGNLAQSRYVLLVLGQQIIPKKNVS